MAALVGEAGRAPRGGGDARLFRLVPGGRVFPPLGHGPDAAAADRDDREAGQHGVQDGVDYVLGDVELVERGDDTDGQGRPAPSPARAGAEVERGISGRHGADRRPRRAHRSAPCGPARWPRAAR